MKQKISIKPKAVKPFNLFISDSSGVGKSLLIKTIYQSVTTFLQYHGARLHSVLGLPCRGKLFPLGSNTLAAMRNKYAEVELIILDEISMYLKQCFIKCIIVS